MLKWLIRLDFHGNTAVGCAVKEDGTLPQQDSYLGGFLVTFNMYIFISSLKSTAWKKQPSCSLVL